MTTEVERLVMRFYVDERGGCIAVRDREKDDEWSSGLHPDMEGVMAYWTGYQDFDEKGMMRWNLHDWQREKAECLCAELNA